MLSSQLHTSGVANILITLPGPATALSLNYGSWTGLGVTFLLSNGDTVSQVGSSGNVLGANVFRSDRQHVFHVGPCDVAR